MGRTGLTLAPTLLPLLLLPLFLFHLPPSLAAPAVHRPGFTRPLNWPDFTEIRCFTKTDPGPVIGKNTPRAVHVEKLAQIIGDLDKKPQGNLRTFSAPNAFPGQDIDYFLPIVKSHLTAQGSIQMRKGHEKEKGFEFVHHIKDGVEYIQEHCSGEKGYIGGAVNLNEAMSLGLWGRKVIRGTQVEGDGAEGEEEVEANFGPEGIWRDSVLSLDQLNGDRKWTGTLTGAVVEPLDLSLTQKWKRDIDVAVDAGTGAR